MPSRPQRRAQRRADERFCLPHRRDMFEMRAGRPTILDESSPVHAPEPGRCCQGRGPILCDAYRRVPTSACRAASSDHESSRRRLVPHVAKVVGRTSRRLQDGVHRMDLTRRGTPGWSLAVRREWVVRPMYVGGHGPDLPPDHHPRRDVIGRGRSSARLPRFVLGAQRGAWTSARADRPRLRAGRVPARRDALLAGSGPLVGAPGAITGALARGRRPTFVRRADPVIRRQRTGAAVPGGASTSLAWRRTGLHAFLADMLGIERPGHAARTRS